jgi:hypothetical protein
MYELQIFEAGEESVSADHWIKYEVPALEPIQKKGRLVYTMRPDDWQEEIPIPGAGYVEIIHPDGTKTSFDYDRRDTLGLRPDANPPGQPVRRPNKGSLYGRGYPKQWHSKPETMWVQLNDSKTEPIVQVRVRKIAPHGVFGGLGSGELYIYVPIKLALYVPEQQPAEQQPAEQQAAEQREAGQ